MIRGISELKVAISMVLTTITGLVLFGCARYSAVGECRAFGIMQGYYSGAGQRCVDAKLDPSSRALVESVASQACSRARKVDQTGDPDAACEQARIEARRAAWIEIASTPPGSTPDLSVDNLLLSLRLPERRETAPQIQTQTPAQTPQIQPQTPPVASRGVTEQSALTKGPAKEGARPSYPSRDVSFATHAKSGFKVTGQDGDIRFVLIEKDSERKRASYDEAIAKLCRTVQSCTIHFWSDPALTPSNPPLSPEQANAEIATYTKDARTGSEQFLWSCRIKNDPDHCF